MASTTSDETTTEQDNTTTSDDEDLSEYLSNSFTEESSSLSTPTENLTRDY